MRRGRPKTDVVLKHSQIVFYALKRLAENSGGWANLTILEKHTNLHHQQISRALEVIRPFIEEIQGSDIFPTNLRLRMVKLKDSSQNFENVLKYIKLNNMIQEEE